MRQFSQTPEKLNTRSETHLPKIRKNVSQAAFLRRAEKRHQAFLSKISPPETLIHQFREEDIRYLSARMNSTKNMAEYLLILQIIVEGIAEKFASK